ncbi:unknown [Clostridium sp. CAG:524]|nr:unknown [Clostridium sp. CAG:524]
MLKRIIYFILGIIITSSALMYIVIYLNLLRMGYSMLDYVKYVFSSIECTKIFIGIILIILSLKKGRKNELYLQYKSEFKE